jgi:hypothetical protein
MGFAVGGHLVGRLCGPLIGTQKQEDLRAGMHGVAMWALTVAIASLVLGTAGFGAANLAEGAMAHHTQINAYDRNSEGVVTDYWVDKLFVPASNGAASSSDADNGARAEAGRLLTIGFVRAGTLSDEDRDRLARLVAARTRLAVDDAAKRVGDVTGRMHVALMAAAERARKTASYSSLWAGLALLFGLLVAIGAAIHARIETDRETKSQL